MKIGWATDIHLDFVEPKRFNTFTNQVNDAGIDHLLISGDLAVADILRDRFQKLASTLNSDITFVLGNHDFYGSSFAEVGKNVPKWAAEAGLNYGHQQVTRLTKKTCLVGLNGWADGTAGVGKRSNIELNDFYHIEDFKKLSVTQRFKKLRELGEENAAKTRELLIRALETDAPNILFLTHVPPFVEAAWHKGKPSNPDWAPHFSTPLVGEVLLEFANAEPSREFMVLCGHCHGEGRYQPLPNLRVHTGGAEYERPVLQGFIDDLK